MTWRVMILTLLATLLAPPAIADEPAEPAQPPKPVAETPGEGASAEQWLDAIEARASDLETLRAEVALLTIQPLLGDRQWRFGHLVYHAGPPARFNLHFDRRAADEHLVEDDQRWIFDGRWLAERLEQRRQFIRRELVPPERAGEDLLRLGEGPFVLPLDLERETVMQRFEVELIQEQGDPFADEREGVPAFENTVRLRLTPREGVQVEQSRIDLWYDRDLLLPVRAFTVRDEDGRESVISLRRFETGFEADEQTFSTEPPDEPGWQVVEHRLEDRGGFGGPGQAPGREGGAGEPRGGGGVDRPRGRA